MDPIHKIGAIVIRDNRILMVKKAGKNTWTSLGGRIEAGESEEETLRREIVEEIGCQAEILRKLDDFFADAVHDQGRGLKLSLYLTELKGEIKVIDPELEKAEFIGKDFQEQGIKLPPSYSQAVIPFLIKKGLIEW